jgi:Caspase domain
LYDQGLGVKKDPSESFKWVAKASGLSDHTLANLSLKHQPDPLAASRIRELEQALAGKEKEIRSLTGDLHRVNTEVSTLRRDLADRAAHAQQARATIQQQEQQVQALQAEYNALQAKPDARHQAALVDRQLRELADTVTQNRRQLSDRETEVAQLQHRITLLEKNAERIQVLEQTMARKDSEAQTLRAQLASANQHLTQLSGQLNDRQKTALDNQRKSLETEERFQKAQAELAQLKMRPDQTSVIAKYEDTVKKLQQDAAQAKRESQARAQEVAQLQQKMVWLEAEADKQTKALQAAAVTDLGFDGPSLDIIDPPLAKTRGIQVATDQAVVPVGAGTRRSITGRVLAPAGLRTLTVNGDFIKPNTDGIFTAALPPLRSQADEIAVQILAVDMQNKRTALKFSLKAKGATRMAPALSKLDTSGFGRYHALVIGNDHYKHWPQLMNAIADATAIADVLKKNYGFQVTLLKDASRAQVMKALNQYRKVLTEKDNLLIYYAGHGHLEQGIDRGYWIPVDAETNDNSEWVLLPSVTDMLQLIAAKHVMVVADSCFGGKLTRSALAQLKPGLTDDARIDLLKTLAQKRVRTAMTSGGVKPVLDAGGSGHSVFAEAFLGVLEENGTVLEAERLFWAVRTRVVSLSQKLNAEQIPTYDPIHMAGHESLGDFIFVPQAL